jgi:hypothetical protein
MEQFLPQIGLDCYDAVRHKRRRNTPTKMSNDKRSHQFFDAQAGKPRGRRAGAITNNVKYWLRISRLFNADVFLIDFGSGFGEKNAAFPN